MLRTSRRARLAAACTLAALLLPTLTATPAAAQSLSGVRARLWSSAPPLQGAVGTIDSLGADSMHVTLEGRARPVAVPLASVLRLQVSRGDRAESVARGLRWGMLGGVVGGAIYGATRSVGIETTGAEEGFCAEGGRCDHAVRYGLVGVAIGAIAGGIFGAITGSERWDEVRLPSRVR